MFNIYWWQTSVVFSCQHLFILQETAPFSPISTLLFPSLHVILKRLSMYSLVFSSSEVDAKPIRASQPRVYMAQTEPIRVFGETNAEEWGNHQLIKNNNVSQGFGSMFCYLREKESLRTEITQGKAKASLGFIPKTESHLIQK